MMKTKKKNELVCSLCEKLSADFVMTQKKLPRPKCTPCLQELLAPNNFSFFKCKGCGDITMETLRQGVCVLCQGRNDRLMPPRQEEDDDGDEEKWEKEKKSKIYNSFSPLEDLDDDA